MRPSSKAFPIFGPGPHLSHGLWLNRRSTPPRHSAARVPRPSSSAHRWCTSSSTTPDRSSPARAFLASTGPSPGSKSGSGAVRAGSVRVSRRKPFRNCFATRSRSLAPKGSMPSRMKRILHAGPYARPQGCSWRAYFGTRPLPPPGNYAAPASTPPCVVKPDPSLKPWYPSRLIRPVGPLPPTIPSESSIDRPAWRKCL